MIGLAPRCRLIFQIELQVVLDDFRQQYILWVLYKGSHDAAKGSTWKEEWLEYLCVWLIQQNIMQFTLNTHHLSRKSFAVYFYTKLYPKGNTSSKDVKQHISLTRKSNASKFLNDSLCAHLLDPVRSSKNGTTQHITATKQEATRNIYWSTGKQSNASQRWNIMQHKHLHTNMMQRKQLPWSSRISKQKHTSALI